MLRSLAVMFVLALAGSCALADTLRLHDGRIFSGRVVSDSGATLQFETVIANIRTTLEFRKSEIAEVVPGQVPPELIEPAERPTPAKANPASDKGSDAREPLPRYLEVPIVGVIGEEVFASALEEALEHAVRRSVRHVVLLIDTPGGRVREGEAIVRALAKYDDRLHITAVVERAASAGIYPVFASDEVFIRPRGIIGGAVAYSQDSHTGQFEVDQKFNSLMAAGVATIAESKGRAPEIARAMILTSAEAFAWHDGEGKVVVSDRAPAGLASTRLLLADGPTTVLTLTAAQAQAIGLAEEHTGDIDSLGDAVGAGPWQSLSRFGWAAMERAAGAERKKERKAAQVAEEIRAVLSRLQELVLHAEERDPERFNYLVDRSSGFFTPTSRRDWQANTDAAVRAWHEVVNGLKRLRKLELEGADVGIELPSRDELLALADRSQREIERLLNNRNRSGF